MSKADNQQHKRLQPSQSDARRESQMSNHYGLRQASEFPSAPQKPSTQRTSTTTNTLSSTSNAPNRSLKRTGARGYEDHQKWVAQYLSQPQGWEYRADASRAETDGRHERELSAQVNRAEAAMSAKPDRERCGNQAPASVGNSTQSTNCDLLCVGSWATDDELQYRER